MRGRRLAIVQPCARAEPDEPVVLPLLVAVRCVAVQRRLNESEMIGDLTWALNRRGARAPRIAQTVRGGSAGG